MDTGRSPVGGSYLFIMSITMNESSARAARHPSFSSIGWLYGVNGTIILTPIKHGAMMPTKVRITRAQFEAIRHDKAAMMDTAADMIAKGAFAD